MAAELSGGTAARSVARRQKGVPNAGQYVARHIKLMGLAVIASGEPLSRNSPTSRFTLSIVDHAVRSATSTS